jgi:MFS family permease
MANAPVATATAAIGQKVTTSAWAILAAMGFGGFGAALLFSTGIGPALPAIKSDLGLGLSAQTWTITAYGLAFGVALVAGGRLGDLIGEVKVIVAGFVIFGAGLAVSAVAVTGPLMISGRAIQGIGIGVCAPATLSIVINCFPVAQRGFAVGIWGFAHGCGVFAGPLFCSWMMSIAGWRWVFWAGVALAVLVVLATLSATRRYQSVIAHGKYDWPGLIIGGTGITVVTYVLQNSSTRWTAAPAWASLGAGVVLLAVFGFVEKRSASPLVDFGLWKERLFCGGFFAQGVVGFVYIPFLTFIGSLFFIDVLGYSPVKAGWVILITTGICMLCQPLAGKWVDKVGPGIPITVALTLLAVALAWIGLFFGPDTTLTEMVIPLALMGIGNGISWPACYTAGMSAVDTERAGMGSGVVQMGFLIPAALGMALVTSMIGTSTATKITTGLANHAELDELATSYAPASSAAITTSMLVLAVIALTGAIFAWLVISGPRRRRAEARPAAWPACPSATSP